MEQTVKVQLNEVNVHSDSVVNTKDNEPIAVNGILHKRKHSEEASCSKIPRREKNDVDSLVMFPDDVLLIILTYLPHDSLLSLKRTCTLFARLCEDYTLWRDVRYTTTPVTSKDMESIGRLVHSETTSIDVKGSYRTKDTKEDVINSVWMSLISYKCPNLKKLALPRHFINCRTITMASFPSCLTCLDLSNTYLRDLPVGRSYFKDVSLLIPNLKILILSHCDWFEPHSLMAISKCKYLEELRLNDCEQVKDCLAYCGLSTRGGFRALKTLDLRRCLVTTSELVCFSSVPTLINLYLENALVGGQYSPVFIDSAIMALCTRNDIEVRIDGVRAIVNRPMLKVERLTIRYFQLLTDVALVKLARDAHNLQYIDVTGSGVTSGGIEEFKSMRPNVFITNNEIDVT